MNRSGAVFTSGLTTHQSAVLAEHNARNAESLAMQQALKRVRESDFPLAELLNTDTRGNSASRGPLTSDIEDMMYGFGDSWPIDAGAVKLVEQVVKNYIQDLAARALRVAELRPGGKLDKECFMFLVRKDKAKFRRVHRLLSANEEIKRVQKAEIKEDDGK